MPMICRIIPQEFTNRHYFCGKVLTFTKGYYFMGKVIFPFFHFRNANIQFNKKNIYISITSSKFVMMMM